MHEYLSPHGRQSRVIDPAPLSFFHSARLDRQGLRRVRCRIVRNPAGRQEEQRDQSTSPDLRELMRTRPRRSPAGALPALHPHDLRRVIDLDDAVHLPVGMRMVLASIYIAAIHVDGGDAEISRLRDGHRDPAASIFAAVKFRFRHPPFFDPLPHKGAEVLVVGVSWTVVFIQENLEVLPRGSARQNTCQPSS